MDDLDFQKSPSSDFHMAISKFHISKKSFVGFHFVARGRPLRGKKRLAPLAKRSTCSKSMDDREFDLFDSFNNHLNRLTMHFLSIGFCQQMNKQRMTTFFT